MQASRLAGLAKIGSVPGSELDGHLVRLRTGSRRTLRIDYVVLWVHPACCSFPLDCVVERDVSATIVLWLGVELVFVHRKTGPDHHYVH